MQMKQGAAFTQFKVGIPSRTVLVIAVSFWLIPVCARGQFVQYTPPGSLGRSQVLTEELLDTAIQEARWRIGPFRLNPWYSLSNAGYDNNVFATADNKKDDVTVTAGAGVRGYLRFGPDLKLALHALPEYVWWLDLSDRRKLNGRYGTGLFGYFDALTLELEATTSERQRYVSSELDQPVNTQTNRGAGAIEVEFLDRFSIFGSAETEMWHYDEKGVVGPYSQRVLLLERREDLARGGFRYRFSNSLSLGIGLEYSNVVFLRPENDRSNEGAAPLLEMRFLHPRFQADISLASRSLEPKDGSIFRSYDGITGRASASWKPGSRLEYQLYASRNIVYSIHEEIIYFEDQRIGGAVSAPIGWRIRARAFYEKGTNNYVMLDPSAASSLDERTAYGGTIDIRLGESATFRVDVSRMSHYSDLPGQSRSIFRITTAVTTGSGGLWY